MEIWEHVKVFILLPFDITIVIPISILLITGELHLGWFLMFPFTTFPIVGGCTLIGLSFFALGKTVLLFTKSWKGTLSHWESLKKLVVRGVYRYVRNPII
ncbi:MAG: hypothetical protein ACE5R6_17850 [Candidatus Heimdallarchaeota archaeon]